MAPSVTEILFALDLGDRVVGVTRYCDFPAQARSRPRVGGYLDPNYEAIVRLQPDIVFLIQDHQDVASRLAALGVRSHLVDHHDVGGILASIETIADTCAVLPAGFLLVGRIEDALGAVRTRVHGRKPPRAVVVVGREAGGGRVGTLWVAGPGSFYNDVLTMAGGLNACGPSAVAYPELSREGLAHLDPDVILDIVPGVERSGLEPAAVRAEWDGLGELRAVRNDTVHVLGAEVLEIPGPRIAETVEAVARVLHPDADWWDR